jgi:hypothetical protein
LSAVSIALASGVRVAKIDIDDRPTRLEQCRLMKADQPLVALRS